MFMFKAFLQQLLYLNPYIYYFVGYSIIFLVNYDVTYLFVCFFLLLIGVINNKHSFFFSFRCFFFEKIEI